MVTLIRMDLSEGEVIDNFRPIPLLNTELKILDGDRVWSLQAKRVY